MVISEYFYRQNLMQIVSKTHQISPFKKILRGAAPDPPSNTHGDAMRNM